MAGQTFGGASVTDAGGGWWRIALTGTLPEAGASAIVGVLSGGAATFAGDGTSAILVWGPDLTQGVDQARPFTLTQDTIAGPLLFNPPIALTPGGVELWGAVAGGANFGGCNVHVSYDGATYEEVGVIEGRARFGALTASFASGTDPDTTHTLSVDLSASEGDLTSAAQAVADASGTLSLINDPAPELISFETATLTHPNRYDLASYIRRGALNTPIDAHSAQAPFIRLDQAIFDFPYLATQGGKPVFVKFQPFNAWGAGLTPLSNCIAYQAIPVPLGVRPPTSAAWTATATVITNGGASTPAILITGASDNPSASLVEFFYRPTGTSQWIPAGTATNTATQFIIAPVQSMQTYDVAVAYLVNGILGQKQIISAGSTTTGGGGSGGAAGTALLNDSAPGTGKTFTIPSTFTGAHVDVVLTGVPGAGNGQFSGGGGKSVGPAEDQGGGGANTVVVKGFPAAAGDVFTYTLPSAVGSDATVTKTGLSLVAHPGTNATISASGTGGANTGSQTATGAASVTSYAGRNGGLVDTWDGGGPGATIDIPSGAVTAPGPDNTVDQRPGVIAGQGGAGAVYPGPQGGGGCNLLIIARA